MGLNPDGAAGSQGNPVALTVTAGLVTVLAGSWAAWQLWLAVGATALPVLVGFLFEWEGNYTLLWQFSWASA